MVLEKEKLETIYGGASAKNIGLGIIFAALGSFIVGIIDGVITP